ncbi:MAG: aldo/keto reductase [Polyangiales bacterium]
MSVIPGASVTLPSGVTMPRVGLGVFRAGAGEATRASVGAALRAGYRHVDTAAIYRNEREVGEALRAWCDETGGRRDEVFVTSKLWNDDQGYDEALRAYERSERALGVGPLDLFLLHWPVPERRLDSWRALERLCAEGRCRAIGVSNFTAVHLEELLARSERAPDVNQVELHPFLAQRDLVDACRRRGVQTVAYSPLAKGRFLDDPALARVAQRRGASAAQVMIRWCLDQGHVALPKSSNPERIAANLAAADLVLTPEDHAELASCDRGARTAWDPTAVP